MTHLVIFGMSAFIILMWEFYRLKYGITFFEMTELYAHVSNLRYYPESLPEEIRKLSKKYKGDIRSSKSLDDASSTAGIMLIPTAIYFIFAVIYFFSCVNILVVFGFVPVIAAFTLPKLIPEFSLKKKIRKLLNCLILKVKNWLEEEDEEDVTTESIQ